MQSSRDSSVWRSLAVAFGDGLAFGVGMKLTQNAGRTTVTAPQTDLNPLARRLEEMEQRIAEIENRPLALPPAEKVVVSSQPFDQKVLEAVVTALEARLREHASQVERQITELQAKVTIELNTLHQQDRALAQAAEAPLLALRDQISAELTAMRAEAEAERKNVQNGIDRLHEELAGFLAAQLQVIRATADSDRHAFETEVANLQHDIGMVVTEHIDGIRKTADADRLHVETQIANLHHDVADVLGEQLESMQQQLREEMRKSTGELTAMAASAADSAAENRLEPLRAALAARDREVADLRTRLVGNDRATLDLLQSVGEICRRAAERYIATPEPEPQPAAAENDPPPPAPPQSESDVPGFAQSQPPGKLWRVPLVSSLVLTTGAMVFLHYL